MNQFIYGPIPSRRLGKSLGISPIPKKTCNYGCIYCMLDTTTHMTNTPQMYYPVSDILNQLKVVLDQGIEVDVISIVGDGEPTLYEGLKDLILGIRQLSDKPIALISNGALLDQKAVYEACLLVDIFLPSANGYDLRSFKRINRPYRDIDFEAISQALINFSHEFKGELWLELMLVKGINDSMDDFHHYQNFFKQFKYDRLYLNTPIRIPTESYVLPIDDDVMHLAIETLGGIGIRDEHTHGFVSAIEDDFEAIVSLIKRHPMSDLEINQFLDDRNTHDKEKVFVQLDNDDTIQKKVYRNRIVYRK